MKKGISPVVAVVLLIAIAVIAAVGVWYWVGSYTGQPNVTTNVKTMTIQDCNGTHVYVQNTGQDALNTAVHFYTTAGADQGYVGFNATSVASSSSAWVPLLYTNGSARTSAITAGNYDILGTGIQTTPFSYSA